MSIFDIEPVELETSKWSLYNALTSYASHTDALSFNQFNTIHEGAQQLLSHKVDLQTIKAQRR